MSEVPPAQPALKTYSPVHAPAAARAACEREGKEYVAWRQDGPESPWVFVCVPAKLGLQDVRPENRFWKVK